MADDRSDGTIVTDIVGLRIEEWRLQDGSGEVDAVEHRGIEGVHRLRRAGHSGLIYRFTPVFT